MTLFKKILYEVLDEILARIIILILAFCIAVIGVFSPITVLNALEKGLINKK